MRDILLAINKQGNLMLFSNRMNTKVFHMRIFFYFVYFVQESKIICLLIPLLILHDLVLMLMIKDFFFIC